MITIPKHMRDKSKFYMLYNDYGHTIASCRSLYGQLKGMIKKGLLLKYLKKKVPLGSIGRPWETKKTDYKGDW